MPKVATFRKPKNEKLAKESGDDLIDELFENEKSIGFKAKGGGFPFKGKDARKKAMEQARKMKAEKDAKA